MGLKVVLVFKHLDCYNLIVCYSLDPILVIWYVILVIFFRGSMGLF